MVCNKCELTANCHYKNGECPLDNPKSSGLVVEDWARWREMLAYEGMLADDCVEKGTSPIRGCVDEVGIPF